MSTAVAMGVFDGVHRGHQELLRRTVETAKELSLEPMALTFDPHPARVVAPDRAPRLLMSVEERCRWIRAYGVERIHIFPFDARYAAMTPEQFGEQVLCGELHARAVLVGDAFRFGCGRTGDVAALARMGFETRPLAPVVYRGVVVSSSEIRRRIEAGNVSGAGRLLGRPHGVEGEIVRGHGIGSKQTVPTLNLATQAEVLPANGVYITRTTDLGSGKRWRSITNVGTRPTFEMGSALSIETFLLEPLEGATPEQIRLEFLHRVRDERKFPSSEVLKTQILRDVAVANGYFRRLK